MSTNPPDSSNPAPAKQRRGVFSTFPARLGLVAAVVIAAVTGGWVMFSGDDTSSDYPLFTVESGPLTISLSESGTIQSRDLVVVRSQLEGRATILRLVEEGTHVQQGDVLVELDASRLQETRDQQQITVMNAEAAYIRARENLEVVKSQTESDLAAAELRVRFAHMDLSKYLEGEYPQQLRRSDADITIARETLRRAEDKETWSARLAEDGIITQVELEADQLAAERARLNLELARIERDVIETYAHPRRVEQLQSEVTQSEMALERVRRRISADMVQAEAEHNARRSEFNRQQARLAHTIDQIERCVITAPVAGMVVYATTAQASRRRWVEALEAGQEVRERQELIHLPTTASMMAEVKIHESSIKRVRVGQPVRVTVEAVPGQVFTGRVGRIGVMPESAWGAPDVKVYNVEVHLAGDALDLKPGMTCRAEIIIDHLADATFVPVQCVTRVGREMTVYTPGRQGPEPRIVSVGQDNGRMIEIVSGLAAGERILLAPPLAPSTAEDNEPHALTADELTPEIPPAPANGEANGQGEEPAAAAIEGVDLEAVRNMSSEQRQQLMQNLTEQQRRQVREAIGTQPGGGQGRRSPRGSGSESTPRE